MENAPTRRNVVLVEELAVATATVKAGLFAAIITARLSTKMLKVLLTAVPEGQQGKLVS